MKTKAWYYRESGRILTTYCRFPDDNVSYAANDDYEVKNVPWVLKVVLKFVVNNREKYLIV